MPVTMAERARLNQTFLQVRLQQSAQSQQSAQGELMGADTAAAIAAAGPAGAETMQKAARETSLRGLQALLEKCVGDHIFNSMSELENAFAIKTVPSDGACLFWALLEVINKGQSKHTEQDMLLMRKDIVEFVVKKRFNGSIADGKWPVANRERYLLASDCKDTDAWVARHTATKNADGLYPQGDEIVFRAMAAMHDVAIVVAQVETSSDGSVCRAVQVFGDAQSRKDTLFLLHENRCHFGCVLVKPLYESIAHSIALHYAQFQPTAMGLWAGSAQQGTGVFPLVHDEVADQVERDGRLARELANSDSQTRGQSLQDQLTATENCLELSKGKHCAGLDAENADLKTRLLAAEKRANDQHQRANDAMKRAADAEEKLSAAQHHEKLANKRALEHCRMYHAWKQDQSVRALKSHAWFKLVAFASARRMTHVFECSWDMSFTRRIKGEAFYTWRHDSKTVKVKADESKMLVTNNALSKALREIDQLKRDVFEANFNQNEFRDKNLDNNIEILRLRSEIDYLKAQPGYLTEPSFDPDRTTPSVSSNVTRTESSDPDALMRQKNQMHELDTVKAELAQCRIVQAAQKAELVKCQNDLATQAELFDASQEALALTAEKFKIDMQEHMAAQFKSLQEQIQSLAVPVRGHFHSAPSSPRDSPRSAASI